jgi:hypothetical protein
MVVGFITTCAISAIGEDEGLVGWCMVFNATFNHISVILWQSVLGSDVN